MLVRESYGASVPTKIVRVSGHGDCKKWHLEIFIHLGVGTVRLTELAKTLEGGFVHRSLQRQD